MFHVNWIKEMQMKGSSCKSCVKVCHLKLTFSLCTQYFGAMHSHLKEVGPTSNLRDALMQNMRSSLNIMVKSEFFLQKVLFVIVFFQRDLPEIGASSLN